MSYADGDAGEGAGGHPVAATIIGVVLLLGSALGSTRGAHDAPRDGAALAAHICGGGLAGAIFWGIAYAITIKRASQAAKLVSFIMFVVAGLLASFLQLARTGEVTQTDAHDAARQMRQVFDGERLPESVGSGSGPLSRMTATMMNGVLADRNAFDRDTEAAGVRQLITLQGLTRSSPVLQHCDNLAPLAVRARAIGTQGAQTHLAAARAVGDAAVQAGEMSAEDEAGFFSGAEQGIPNAVHQWALTGELVEHAQAVCTLLAGRPWVSSGGRVLFTRPGDAEAANVHLRRISEISTEQEQARTQVNARTREQLNELDR